ncbi:Uncharacterised protein [uncultured archaeon]|nr:Uncharacterised protein [uncultured archaeon]
MKIPALLFVMLLVSGCINVKHEPVSNNSIFPDSSVVDIAKKDLAQRLNITTVEVKLVRQELVNWRDTSLGYPEKETVYEQELTPGFRIILEAGNKTYEYHSDSNTRVVGPKEVGQVQ